MCWHGGVPSREKPIAQARPRLAVLAVALLATSLVFSATPAGADEAAAAVAPKRMKISFTDRTARVAGPGALVEVRCQGVVAASCDGTLTLAVGADAEEVPFSLASGEKRVLVVPVEEAGERLERVGSMTALAVAETVQPTGGVLSSKQRLHLR